MATTTKKKPAKVESGGAEVDAFMLALEHPQKPALEVVRELVRSASPEIAEGIKWNSPSFRVRDYFFATMNLRASVIQIILHQDAKFTVASKTGLSIDDPEKLLEWLGKERASVKLRDIGAVEANREALIAIVRQWIKLLP